MTRMNSQRDGVLLMFVVVSGNAAAISAFDLALCSDVMVDFIFSLEVPAWSLSLARAKKWLSCSAYLVTFPSSGENG